MSANWREKQMAFLLFGAKKYPLIRISANCVRFLESLLRDIDLETAGEKKTVR